MTDEKNIKYFTQPNSDFTSNKTYNKDKENAIYTPIYSEDRAKTVYQDETLKNKFTWENFKSERDKLFENNHVHPHSFMEFGAENVSRDDPISQYRRETICQNENLTFVYPDHLLKDVEVTKSGIPKILWRTYKNTNMPEKWKEGFESGDMLKGWKLIFMTDEDNYEFVKRHYPDLLYKYESFQYNIQRVDLIRILYLHKFGGLYSDLDKVFLTDFTYFFDENMSDVFLVRSPNLHSTYTNSFMASKPKSEFWIELINAILEDKLPFYAYGRHLKVMNSTGPSILTRVAQNTNSVITLLPGKYFESCSVCSYPCKASIENGQYVKQIEGSSWITLDTKFYLCLLCSWPQMILIFLFIIVMIYCTFFI